MNILFYVSYAVHLHIWSLPSQVLWPSAPSACEGWKAFQMMYEAPAKQEQKFLAHTLLRPVLQVCLRVLNGFPPQWIWNNIYHCQKELVEWWEWITRKEIMLSGSDSIITRLVSHNTWKIRIKFLEQKDSLHQKLQRLALKPIQHFLGCDTQSLGETFLKF